MKRNICFFILLVGFLVFLILWLKKPKQIIFGSESINLLQTNISVQDKSNTASTQHTFSLARTNEVRLRAAQINHTRIEMAMLWRTPILYYGKVLDESNRPISGVQVSFNTSSVNEALTKEQYDRGIVTTDERGIFKISGVRGVGMVFQLSHPNYYPYPENITDYDIRDYPKKGKLPDSEENALVFRMHSKGHPVPLVHRRGGADVPVNSGSSTIAFYGQSDKNVIGTLQIEASGNTPKNWSPQPYDWSVRLTVPGGGLIESTNQFDFVAPDSGYEKAIEISMRKDQPGWSDSVNKFFFIKFINGYVRMGIHMRAKTPLYTSLEYYFNPDGSSNLEPQ